MLSQLREIVEQVSRVENIHQALDILVQKTCLAMQTECCTVYLANDDMHRLELMATQGLTFTGDSIHVGYDEGLVGLVKRSAEPLNLAQASSHPSYKFFPELGEDIYHSFLGTPIIYRKQVLGVLVIQQKTPRLFNEIEESFLVTLAAQLAMLIAYAQAQGLWTVHHSLQQVMTGIAASPGVAVGHFWRDNTQLELEKVNPASTLNPDQELETLILAIERALSDFRKMRKRLDAELNKDALAIFDLFTHLLNDPMFRRDLKAQVQQGDRADWALRQVIEAYDRRFANMADAYLRERAQDVRELGQRLLYFLHHTEQEQFDIQQPIILVVRELTATILAAIPPGKLLAVVAMEGAANSHAAILSRALGIPAVMGVTLNIERMHGLEAIVDGYSGEVFIEPSLQLLSEYQSLVVEEKELSSLTEQVLPLRACTKDGKTLSVLLNAGLGYDSNHAINQSVDGVGLYRTEISFLVKQSFPSEEEQTMQYRALLESYPNKPVVMRTLDIGGDKSLPYLPIEEDNPALGWRGIRFTLDHPDIFLIQVRAMLKASRDQHNLRILLPMITSVQELDDAKVLIERAFQEVRSVYPEVRMPQVGIMLEVPSTIYLLGHIADKIDFISVGTNDLTQYLLAVDRNNANVSSIYESMHPAVISALKQILTLSKQHHLPVCVCGELAGDPLGALLLIGLGYTSLSMNASNVARLKYILRQQDSEDLQQLAHKALQQPYGASIYAMMVNYFKNNGLAGFIRAGKR